MQARRRHRMRIRQKDRGTQEIQRFWSHVTQEELGAKPAADEAHGRCERRMPVLEGRECRVVRGRMHESCVVAGESRLRAWTHMRVAEQAVQQHLFTVVVDAEAERKAGGQHELQRHMIVDGLTVLGHVVIVRDTGIGAGYTA